MWYNDPNAFTQEDIDEYKRTTAQYWKDLNITKEEVINFYSEFGKCTATIGMPHTSPQIHINFWEEISLQNIPVYYKEIPIGLRVIRQIKSL